MADIDNTNLSDNDNYTGTLTLIILGIQNFTIYQIWQRLYSELYDS